MNGLVLIACARIGSLAVRKPRRLGGSTEARSPSGMLGASFA